MKKAERIILFVGKSEKNRQIPDGLFLRKTSIELVSWFALSYDFSRRICKLWLLFQQHFRTAIFTVPGTNLCVSPTSLA